MFTIKVLYKGYAGPGYESIYEAREVTKEPNGLLMQIGYDDTIFIGPGGHEMSLDWVGRNITATEPCANAATVYVMNRYGSTVATYHL